MVSLFDAQTRQHVIDAVARGADVNEVQFELPEDDGYGPTPLVTACANGRTQVVEALLEYGADPHYVEDSGFTVILDATINGYRDIIVLLLNAGVNINIGNGVSGFGTPLIIAAEYGHIDCLDLLLEQGADVDAQTEYGHTALMLACSEGHIDVVDRLLQYGANVNIIQKYHCGSWSTALEHACIANDLAIIDRLVAHGADYRVLEDKLSNIPSPEAVKRISDLLGK